jgi:hypothetical protein
MRDQLADTVRIDHGVRGWVRYHDPDLDAVLYLRLQPADDGRLEVCEVYVRTEAGPITSSRWRAALALGLSAAEARVNHRTVRSRLEAGAMDVHAVVEEAISTPPPPSSDETEVTDDVEQEVVDLTGSGDVGQVVVDLVGWAEAAEQSDASSASGDATNPFASTATVEEILTLDIPRTKPLPDSFYRQVATAYEVAVVFGRGPAVRIAEQNGIDVRRVHRWVGEARARGYLPPGRQGRAL